MSEPQSALRHVRHDGFAAIAEIGPLGMITLRATLADPALTKALNAVGLDLPAPRRIRHAQGGSVGWMAPDELLLVVDYAKAEQMVADLYAALKGSHVMAVNVSDARAVFRIEGTKAPQVLAKLCPVDLGALAPDELRRTRAAQVAAAFWRDDAGFTLVCFRSVAVYVMGLLVHSSQPGSEVDPFV